MSARDDRWRIKEFAAIVGVPEATLRAWERRYALLAPQRTSGNFRLYTRDDERRIRSMQAHMVRGMAPAEAAALALSESAVDIEPPSRPGALIEPLLDAAEAFDATRFDALLDAAFSLGTLTAIRDVVLPALAEIGRRWETTEISVGHEHFSSHLIERRLLALAKGWEAGRGPLALLACPSGERHTLGLVCFGLVLAERGWRIAYLGADTPVDQILEMSASIAPTAVVLCARARRHVTSNADPIATLAAQQHTILAGGGATAELAARLGAELAEGDPVVTAETLAADPPPADAALSA
ncbi:MAG: MerR family transcriptional regulator, light-induced transcriptional regulator [Solirubrobacteraceae bacterium]|jgi:DNA-binding transcriptional MerR regulator/methylmalonyl-CoA mutase cobalamin-binding subunit|nr:MerR family transcriptional regulator, light-induced transcriptional regulator [Solirubrobacteraceae bacterium]